MRPRCHGRVLRFPGSSRRDKRGRPRASLAPGPAVTRHLPGLSPGSCGPSPAFGWSKQGASYAAAVPPPSKRPGGDPRHPRVGGGGLRGEVLGTDGAPVPPAKPGLKPLLPTASSRDAMTYPTVPATTRGCKVSPGEEQPPAAAQSGRPRRGGGAGAEVREREAGAGRRAPGVGRRMLGRRFPRDSGAGLAAE